MTDSRLSAKRYLVTGRVQGVSYRYFTRSAAVELELTGWVKNLTDGSVEVRVAGDSDVLARFRERLAAGPRFARVERIDESPYDADELTRDLGHRGFEIRY